MANIDFQCLTERIDFKNSHDERRWSNVGNLFSIWAEWQDGISLLRFDQGIGNNPLQLVIMLGIG